MKRHINQPPYIFEQSRTHKIVLPMTLAILGASVGLMAVMLITSENKPETQNERSDVENYDIVGNQPFIYGICE